ncbi:MAG: hypothetical protein H7Y37_08210 [Anaerolineae bacterium]|nr:hypothetical protein [Gloeobacterales cyanobacterium ES-bin-313]
MNIISSFQQVIQYIAEAVEEVPSIGVQPFKGDLEGFFHDWMPERSCPLSCSIERF